MEQIFAEYNHARWIAICPRCRGNGEISAALVKPGDVFVCPVEYPDLLATTLMPNPRVKGAFNSIPDEPLRNETRQAAIAAGDGYEVVFPVDKEPIEAILRKRPVAGRNWRPGVTLDDLRGENIVNGLEG